ncbi:hypothetical protein GPS50_14725 [Acinetobacter haemolyticus]|nr:hypothetical protein [Acinetobacter haemolyticus]NAR80929.1 hypothetical protein [Acinetobacter haemolyticus]NAR90142.1 hypothetical protein [Acinetobacter haemolyticus]NAR96317.1 hypothetical protein [Acinetobacter haemolyticus]
MFITSFGEQNITYKCCSNFLIHLWMYFCVCETKHFFVTRWLNKDTTYFIFK